MPWFFGNTHCHSTRSDGDSHPAAVARFYRDHGFDFVAISDHNQRTGPEDVGEELAGFTVLPACEYSAHVEGRALHINGIGATATVAADKQPRDVAGTVQLALDAFRAQGAFTTLNHPNWHWGLGVEDLCAARGADAVELWNGARDSNNLGDEEHPSTERLWDLALSAGARLWAVASDDCHAFGHRRRYRSDAPFSGWIAVEAVSRRADHLLDALRAGSFYASTGPRIEHLRRSADGIEVVAEAWGQVVQRVVFVGAGGRELARVRGREARYVPRGDEGYVRARVETGEGDRAWTQPLFLPR